LNDNLIAWLRVSLILKNLRKQNNCQVGIKKTINDT